jgi:cell division protease FtsH
MFGMGKSRAKLFAKGKQSIKFSDVAGVDEAKKELEEVVDFLKNPKKYRDLGRQNTKGSFVDRPFRCR